SKCATYPQSDPLSILVRLNAAVIVQIVDISSQVDGVVAELRRDPEGTCIKCVGCSHARIVIEALSEVGNPCRDVGGLVLNRSFVGRRYGSRKAGVPDEV